MLSGYFNYIFVHLRQKPRLRSKISPKFLSTLGPNPARTRPEKPGQTYNSGPNGHRVKHPHPVPVTSNKSNLLLYSQYYAQACNEFTGPISASLGPGNTAAFEEINKNLVVMF